MRPTFYPRLVNPSHQDPALYVANTFDGSAILFDAGDLTPLSNRELLKVEHLFITHTHMDHFSGFDRLLRLLLGRDKVLNLYGPQGFIENLKSKLTSYQWNLVKNFTYSLSVKAMEITEGRRYFCRFNCRDGFKPSHSKTIHADDNTLLDTPTLKVGAAI